MGLSLHSSVEAAVKFRLSKSAERAFKSEPSYLYFTFATQVVANVGR